MWKIKPKILFMLLLRIKKACQSLFPYAHHKEAMEISAVLIWMAMEYPMGLKGEADVSGRIVCLDSALLRGSSHGLGCSWVHLIVVMLEGKSSAPWCLWCKADLEGLRFNEAWVWGVPIVVLQFARVNLVGFSDAITLSCYSCFPCLLSRPVRSADLTGIQASA